MTPASETENRARMERSPRAELQLARKPPPLARAACGPVEAVTVMKFTASIQPIRRTLDAISTVSRVKFSDLSGP